MSRLRLFLRCVGEAVCAHGLKALLSTVPLGEAVYEIARDTYERLQREVREKEQLAMLSAAAQAGTEEVRREAAAAVAEIREQVELPPEAEVKLELYLERVPSAVRASLRRPADPLGKTLPATMRFDRPEQLATMLPSHMPRFQAGDRPVGVGNWKLMELLGSGGFGEVWKAKHPSLDGIPPVALKFCLDASASSALRQEAVLLNQVMQQASHPGFVPLRQAYLDAEPLCLEYEYVAGGDLVGLVNGWHAGNLLLEQINHTTLELTRIIAHAHQLRPPIVHRDLKPSNILVHRDGAKYRLRVTDYGIGGVAKGFGGTERQGMLTTSLRGSHTPLYASPQQKAGQDPDPRDDVHALGVIWYQMLTGDLANGLPADWISVLQDLGQPAALVSLLGESVASRAEKRIVNAAVLAERLDALLRKRTVNDLPEALLVEDAPTRRPIQRAEPAPTQRRLQDESRKAPTTARQTSDTRRSRRADIRPKGEIATDLDQRRFMVRLVLFGSGGFVVLVGLFCGFCSFLSSFGSPSNNANVRKDGGQQIGKDGRPKDSNQIKDGGKPALKGAALFRAAEWQVRADGTRSKGPKLPKTFRPITVGDNAVFFPHEPANFVAVGAGVTDAGQKKFQVYNVLNGSPYGQAAPTELEDGKRLAVSPNGQWLASRLRGQPTIGQVRNSLSGQANNVDCKGDSGWVVGQVEFASPGRAVFMTQNGENASPDSEMRFVVFDYPDGKQISAGRVPRQFHPRWATFSHGGRYLAMVVKVEGVDFLAFWDLTDKQAKLAGAIEVKAKGEPAAVAISRDGSRVAMLWRTNNGGEWGRLLSWNVNDRSVASDHPVTAASVQGLNGLFDAGGKKALAWLPDGSGWLLFGHLVIDHTTGGPIGELKRNRGREASVERVFRGFTEVTDIDGTPRVLNSLPLPKR